MEATQLIDPAFWHSTRGVLMGRPEVNLPFPLVGFQSSGTMGKARWIGLSREALLLSATCVNRHLGVGSGSCWGLALPLRHVGGFGVAARAYEAGSRLCVFDRKWNAGDFAEWVADERVSHTSLVPTQVYDLVVAGCRAPGGLGVAVVGGGRLGDDLGRRARELGWPVLASYGLTEAGSQVATQGLDALDDPYSSSPLPVLPHWTVEIGEGHAIRLAGGALFAGLLGEADGRWEFEPREDTWFESGDRGELGTSGLTILGRRDALAKVLGELVDPLEVEKELGLEGVCVVAMTDPRREHRLVAIVEREDEAETARHRIAVHACGVPAHRRVEEVRVMQFPRSALGKIQRVLLAERLCDGPI